MTGERQQGWAVTNAERAVWSFPSLLSAVK